MEYGIVEMSEKVTIGITARTNNFSLDMGAVIGGLWKMDLNRAFLADYEEYLDNDMENGEIHIYIGLKEA